MVDLGNLYSNYKCTEIWDALRKDAKSTIIAFSSALKKERAKNSSCKNLPSITSGKSNGLAKCCFDHTSKSNTDFEWNQFVWRKNHVRKDDNGIQSGMYMRNPHDHEKWQERKSAGNSARGDKQKTTAAENHKAPDAEPVSSDKGGKKFSLSKSFKTALVTQVMLSYSESNHLVNKVSSSVFDTLK